tara:strand:+ start:36 stop:575 length:540 start_codon:yes stop_codon:yes gene_type:complete
MGAGILPVAMYRGTLFLLLGKERNNAWSDFGGSPNNGEDIFKTAIREGYEELNGFFGDEDELKELVTKNNVFKIGLEERTNKNKKKIYTTFIFSIKYDKNLPIYFNNMNKFAEKHLSDKVNKHHNGLFEKKKIDWFSISDLREKKIELREWYTPLLDSVIKNEKIIIATIKKNSQVTSH